jgi:N-acetylmuramoyl-L-alanine amidase
MTRRIKYIVLHCTATPVETKVSSILRYWKEILGWRNPGYHFIIEANGVVTELQPVAKASNGVKGYNKNAIHVAYIGGKNGEDTRTIAQITAMEALVRELHCNHPDAEIKGHRDFPGVTKECPSFDVATWLKSIGLMLCFLLMLSCGSKKKVVERTEEKVNEITRITKEEVLNNSETVFFNDTLIGSLPIPEIKTERKIVIPIESSGLKVDLKLTNGKLDYKVIAKPVSKTSTSDKTLKEQSTKNITSEKQASKRDKEVTRFNWFWWLLLVTIGFLIYQYWPAIKTLITKLKGRL